MKEALLSRTEAAGAPSAVGRATRNHNVGYISCYNYNYNL